MSVRRKTIDEPSINLTPMIDVVFLLLIFFLVGSSFDNSSSSTTVSIPNPSEMRAMTREPDAKVVRVEASGQVSLDGQPMTIDQLIGVLQQQHQGYPDLKVVVDVSSDLPSGQTHSIVQRIALIGVKRVDFDSHTSGSLRR